MNKKKVATELTKLAKGLTAKAEIDFQDMAKQLEDLIEEIDAHMNVYERDYDRGDASKIDKATRYLIEAKKTFAKMTAYDEDPDYDENPYG